MVTKPTYAVNNIQSLPDLVVDQAAALKVTFDKTGADTKTYLGGLCDEIDAHIAKSATHTNADITYYVDTTNGNDNNDGLSSGSGAFKTITKAISVIPPVVNHTITVNIASGTYNENVYLSGFLGAGAINIYGPDSLGDSVLVIRCRALYNTCSITFRGLSATTTTLTSFAGVGNLSVTFSKCKTTSAASQAGFYLANGLYIVSGCQASNKSIGLNSDAPSIVFSSNWTAGTGNTVGISATNGAKIAKSGTQPGGTTAEVTGTGGQIL